MGRYRSLAWGLYGALLAALVNGSGCSLNVSSPDALQRSAHQPEGASGVVSKPGWVYQKQAVAAAHPLAAEAGRSILRAGGSAVDAAIAVQLVLSLVEPQSSGIGGGAFLMHFDGTEVTAWDGRETAPLAARADMFVGPSGTPLPFLDAVRRPQSVGVPGVVAMLEQVHQRYGRLPWASLFAPAIALSQQGFPVTPRLHTLLQSDPLLRTDVVAAAYFYDPHGQPWPVGHVLKNPEFAHILQRIAQGGSRAFYEGAIAQAVIAAVGKGPDGHPAMSPADLAGYRSIPRSPLCFLYPARGAPRPQSAETPAARSLRVCGFPPPGSGAIAVGQILGMLTHTAADRLPFNGKRNVGAGAAPVAPDPQWLFQYAEAARLAFADRALYVADPAFVAPPAGDWLSLIDPAYLRFRASLIGSQAMKGAQAGDPTAFWKAKLGLGRSAWPYAAMMEQPEYGTSHMSIIDGYGQALAMTSSIEAAFGARRMVTTEPTRPGGFLLNNQLTDFSFMPVDAGGKPVANRVEPGKRPRSSMSPLLVLDTQTGDVVMSLGSPGGVQIIHYATKALYGMVHWGLSPQQAIDLPNIGFSHGPLLLEEGQFAPSVIAALRGRGLEVREVALTSGIHALQRSSQGIEGGADPRREGLVVGD